MHHRSSTRFLCQGWIPALLVLLAPSATAQSGRQPITPSTQTALPDGSVVASDPPGLTAPPADAPGPVALNVDGGPLPVIDVELPDDVPPAVHARYASGDDGDVLVEPAAGDPFFLSFGAGSYRPPRAERLDPRLLAGVKVAPQDGRPEPVVYGYAMLSRRITPERKAALEALGCRVLGLRPSNCLVVAARPDALDRIAFAPDVRWLGVARPWQKIGPALARYRERNGDAEPILMWVSLFESDLGPQSEQVPYGEAVPVGIAAPAPGAGEPDPRPTRTRTNGWQERALEALGVEVLEYSRLNPAFLVRTVPSMAPFLVELDFVQVVDMQGIPALAHDESMPMVHADYGRSYYNGAANQVAIVGQVDSGMYQQHDDLKHLGGIGWDPGGGSDPWTDWCGHGSHVVGTILGDGTVEAGHRGAAPGLGWGNSGRVFNVKMFDSFCNWNGTTMQTAISIMGQPAFSTPKPHVINNSHGCPIGSCGGPFIGTEQEAVDLDTAAYQGDQLWVFAAGNEGPSFGTLRLEPSAKNMLTVGNVSDQVEGNQDPGEIWTDSSRGPTADGRWKPNVCAPGHVVTSVQAQTSNGYVNMSGTSMATPHVVGVASQLVDAYSFLRYAPARLSSLLMATALTRDDQVLTSPGDNHLRHYGTGRVDALRALHATSQFGWTNWGLTLGAGQGTYADFTVGAGATRLIVCMHYIEPAAAVGAGKALVSDFDLFLDQAPIDPALNTGEWTAQQSGLDNTEIRILDNPQVGAWRWKIYPYNAPVGAKFGVTVSVIYGDTTPDGTLVVMADRAFAKPNENFQFTATASNPSYVASAVYLDSIPTAGGGLSVSTTTLYDGAVTSLLDNATNGWDVLLGNIGPFASRSAMWRVRWPSEGWKTWTVNARSDNWVDRYAAVNVGVDGTPPAAPYNFASMTHTVGTWSNQPDVTVVWSEPSDNLAGIEGYGWSASLGAPATPPAVQTLPTATLVTANLGSSTQGQYVNVRAVDKAGNWGAAGSGGPYLIDLDAPIPGATLISSSHGTGTSSCNTTITMNWSPAFDAHSGIAGYIGLWDFSPSTAPSGSPNLAAGAVSFTTTLSGSPQPRWFHLRPVDLAGNLGATKHAGFYILDDYPVATYCTAKVNSMGCTPTIAAGGNPSLSEGSFRVVATNVINNKNGLLIWARDEAAIPFQGGYLCVGSPLHRSPGSNSGGNPPPNDCSGHLSFTWTTDYLLSWGLEVGDTVYCQFWSRDPVDPFGSSLSNALSFTLCE